MNARAAVVVLGLLTLGAARGASDGDRIAVERAEAIATFEREQRDCQTRFVVTPCLDASRARQTATLDRLKRETLERDEAARRAQGAARAQAIRDRVAAQAARASEADAASAPESARRLPKPNPPLDRPDRERSRIGPAASAGKARKRTDEQAEQARFDARERAAQSHREAVQQRNARLAAQGKLAAPLPVPAGAAPPALPAAPAASAR